MSQFYDEMAQLVIDMLKEYGMDLTCVHTDNSTNAITTSTLRGIFVDPKKYVIPDSTLGPEDRRIIVDGQIQPFVSDRLQDKYLVMLVKPIQPAERVLGYTLDLRIG